MHNQPFNMLNRIRIPLSILSFCFLAFLSNAQVQAQLIESDQYESGVLFFKLQEESNINSQMIERSDEERQAILFEFLDLDQSYYGITSIERTFKLLGDEYIDLGSVYTIHFDELIYTDDLLSSLMADERLEYAERVPIRKTQQIYQYNHTPNDPDFGSQWHIDQINGKEAMAKFSDCMKGNNNVYDISNVVIAIVDDAIFTDHEDLEDAIWTNPNETNNGQDDDRNQHIDDINGWDIGDNDNNVNPPTSGLCDVQNGHFEHGTHVAGIAAAITDNSDGIASLTGGHEYTPTWPAGAPIIEGTGVTILPVKCGRDNNSPQCGTAIFGGYHGIEYAVHKGANVINCSWGGNVYNYTEELIVNRAYSQGVVIVAAVGNDGKNLDNSPTYPAAYTNVIAVGATDQSDVKATFSNYGGIVDVMAPGVDIYSSLPTALNGYGTLSGTSMAAPIVSSMAAMILALDPSMSPDDVRNVLKLSADNIYSVGGNSAYTDKLGAGRVNAYKAADMACRLSRTTPLRVSSNFQTVCPSQWVNFIALKNQASQVINNISWSFPGGYVENGNTLTPRVRYGNEGVYSVTLTYTDYYNNQRTIFLEDYITVRTGSTNFSDKIDNHWYVNSEGHVSFKDNQVSGENAVAASHLEGVATVSNTNGNLLFYNIEGTIYNRFNEIMGSLLGVSTTQTLILPAPGPCNSLYHIFTIQAQDAGGLKHSIVDMQGDFGRGTLTVIEDDVLPTGEIVHEKISALPNCDGTGWWIVVQNTNHVFRAVELTAAGLSTTIVTSFTANSSGHAGVIKPSPSGEKIAVCNRGDFSVDVYDFNRLTGVMTTPVVDCGGLASLPFDAYNCEFSLNGEVLYVQGGSGKILQVDLTTTACTTRTIDLTGPSNPHGFELGPDGRIYFVNVPFGHNPNHPIPDFMNYVGVIQSPNTLGAGSNVELHGIELDVGIHSVVLANGVVSRNLNFQREHQLGLPVFVTKCQGETFTLESNFDPSWISYEWFDEEGVELTHSNAGSIDIENPGIYTLEVVTPGGCPISGSVVVKDEVIHPSFFDNVVLDCGETRTLDAGMGFASYWWSNGETDRYIDVNAPGKIFLEVTTETGCFSEQEVVIESSCCKLELPTDPFEKEYYSDKYDIFTQGVIADKTTVGNYVAVGTSREKPSLGEPYIDNGLTLLSVNDKGELNWIRKYAVSDLMPVIHDNVSNSLTFSVEDIRSNQNNFILTAVGHDISGTYFSLIAVFDYDGNIQSVDRINSSTGVLLLNSIDDGGGPLGNHLIVGDHSSPAGQGAFFGNFNNNGVPQWEQKINFTNSNFVTSSGYGVESCTNHNVYTTALDGYVVAAVCNYNSGGVSDKGLAVMKTNTAGTVISMKRILGVHHLSSDYKLLETTMYNGSARAFLLMYNDASSRIHLIKLDVNLDVVWAYKYNIMGSLVDFDHAYDVVEHSGVYKILAATKLNQGQLNRGLLFEVGNDGSILNSTLTRTKLAFQGHATANLASTSKGYNDRLLMADDNYISVATGSNDGVSFIKWDANHRTTCSDDLQFERTPFVPEIAYMFSTFDYVQESAGLSLAPIELTEVDICAHQYCCKDGTLNYLEKGCYFTPDFDFELPCGENKIVITDVSYRGIVCGIPTYSWTLDGVEVSIDHLPEILGVTDEHHEICLTMSLFPGCSKTVCQNVWIGPTFSNQTLRTCTGFIRFMPEDCETYYSYEIVDHDPSDDLLYNYNYNSLDPVYGGPGCIGWVEHNLKEGQYTYKFYDDNGCLVEIMELSVMPYQIIHETETLKTCDLFVYHEFDNCDTYGSYQIFDHDPSDDQWHDYNYRSEDNPHLGDRPGCPGWIYHNFKQGHYTIHFFDDDGCLRKIVELFVVTGDPIVKYRDIIICPDQCAHVDINDPNFFCQTNSGSFFGTVDYGSYFDPISSTTNYSFCYPFPPGVTYEFITTSSGGCQCKVMGNIIVVEDCDDPILPAVPAIVGVEELKPIVLNIYPNPTGGQVTLEYEGPIGNGAMVSVYDLVGRHQFSLPLKEQMSIGLQDQSKGSYLLRVHNGTEITYRKLVKE